MTYLKTLLLLILTSSVLVLQTTHLKAADPNIQQARQLIENLGDEVLDAVMLFSRNELTREQLRQRFITLLQRDFDIPWLARFVLGRYYRKATKQERAEYLRLFPQYIRQTYFEQFQAYSGETFRIGDVQRKKSYIFVDSTVLLGQEQSDAVPLVWRLRQNKQDEWKIVDIEVAGVSVGRTIRKELSSFIQRSGGRIGKFLQTLEQKVQG